MTVTSIDYKYLEGKVKRIPNGVSKDIKSLRRKFEQCISANRRKALFKTRLGTRTKELTSCASA
jgi:hypothetical protein